MESGSPVRLSPADKSEVASGEQLKSYPVQAGEDNEVCTCKLVESYYYYNRSVQFVVSHLNSFGRMMVLYT